MNKFFHRSAAALAGELKGDDLAKLFRGAAALMDTIGESETELAEAARLCDDWFASLPLKTRLLVLPLFAATALEAYKVADGDPAELEGSGRREISEKRTDFDGLPPLEPMADDERREAVAEAGTQLRSFAEAADAAVLKAIATAAGSYIEAAEATPADGRHTCGVEIRLSPAHSAAVGAALALAGNLLRAAIGPRFEIIESELDAAVARAAKGGTPV